MPLTCWLDMPLGAGILCWVLAYNTIERKNDFGKCDFSESEVV